VPDQPIVRVDLTPQQRTTAYRHGYVELTPAQAARAGAIVRGSRGGKHSRNLEMCGCGCRLTLARALRRHPSRAVPAGSGAAGAAGAAAPAAGGTANDTLPQGETA
jgi:hypothetical protein